MKTKTVGGVVFTFMPSEDPQCEDSEWEATINGVKFSVQVLQDGRFGPSRYLDGKILYMPETKHLDTAMSVCVA